MSIRRIDKDSGRFKKIIRERVKKGLRRYLSFPEAVVIFMLDASESMKEFLETIKTAIFWITLWLNDQYPGIEQVFVIHDSWAREVTEAEFFRISGAGGTFISPVYRFSDRLIMERYPPDKWNVYGFHFTDGDNWADDNFKAACALAELLPKCNLFGYCQVRSQWGTGAFLKALTLMFKEDRNIRWFELKTKLMIMDLIRCFFGPESKPAKQLSLF